MAANPYKTLGVANDATAAQIKSAYLKLAKKHHPDLNPGDKKAEDKFKAINAANDMLSDADKRGKFDRGEIDATGQERPDRTFYRGYAEGRQGRRARQPTPEEAAAFQDIFADLFRNAGKGRAAGAGAGRSANAGGFTGFQGFGGQDFADPPGAYQHAHQRYALSIPFLEAARGATRRLTLPDGRTLDVTIPAGIEDGQTLRLRGQGDPGQNGQAGDALIEVDIIPHPHFKRDGNDIHLDLPVTAAEAALGAKIAVPTPGGPVTMAIPRHSDTGTQLRLRGRGIAAHGKQPAGDLYVTLKVVLGTPDAALEDALRAFAERNPTDPRKHLMEAS